jgi:hypothetical protein
MANKRIQLTYLWTDESVLMDDVRTKVSATMTDWATEFYAQNGFDVNVEPGPLLRNSFPRLAKYVLKKNDGERPDMRDPSAIGAENVARIEVLDKQIADADRELAGLQDLESKLETETEFWNGEIDRLRADPTSTYAEREQAADQHRFAANALYKTLKRVIDLLGKIQELVSQELPLATDRYDQVMRASREGQLRLQMRDKFVNDKIGSGQRLNIVFCRPSRPPTLAMRGQKRASGLTVMPLGWPTVATTPTGPPSLLWAYPFVIVNVEKAERRTVAHELVHAAGHNHPDPIKVYTGIEKRVARLPRGSLFGAPIRDIEITLEEYSYEYLSGEFDGAANDIMNYTLDDPDPAECILSKDDKDLLDKKPFFVVDP